MRRSDFIKSMLACLVIGYGVVARGQDPTGFTEQLNGARNALGLRAVGFDGSAVPISQQNNAAQRAYGLGHHVTAGLAQCAAIGCGDTAGTLAAWLNSPGHAAIILSPALSAVGYANDGYCATVACSMGNTNQWGSAVQGWPMPVPVSSAGPSIQPRFRLFRRCR